MKRIATLLALAAAPLLPLKATAEHFTEGKQVPGSTEQLKAGDFT